VDSEGAKEEDCDEAMGGDGEWCRRACSSGTTCRCRRGEFLEMIKLESDIFSEEHNFEQIGI
jgi:hypothetical protein